MLRLTQTPRLSLLFGVALGLCLLLPVSPVGAQALGANEQVPLLLKVLSLDRKYARKEKPFALAVLYDSQTDRSGKAMAAFLAALGEGPKVREQPIEVKSFDLSDKEAHLRDFLVSEKIDLVWVTTGLDEHLERVRQRTRAAHVTSAAADVAHVERGLSVGFERAGANTRVVINLEAAKAEACDFSASLLKVARLVKAAPAATNEEPTPAEKP
ncbi:MAG: YfiR family protein [Chrysiogenetes bacterium]|nr:YfiR family protein [Chrysiogenetes bacterium]